MKYKFPERSHSHLHGVCLPTASSAISKHRGIASTENSRNQGAHFFAEYMSHIVIFLPKERVQLVALIPAKVKDKKTETVRTPHHQNQISPTEKSKGGNFMRPGLWVFEINSNLFLRNLEISFQDGDARNRVAVFC